MTTAPLTVHKGHGTENDFVIIDDLDDEIDMSPGFVRALCNRRTGVGADGVIRVVRVGASGTAAASVSVSGAGSGAQAVDSVPTDSEPEFFMDYRNSDGSVAEMCGNGARVFVRYLLDRGLIERGLIERAGLSIATRAGPVAVTGPGDGDPDGWITVGLGPSGWHDVAPQVGAPGLVAPRLGLAVSMPNPHVVVFVDESELGALDLSRPPTVDPPLPSGQNVEFVVRGGQELRMRVHERGVGETRSCGTGIAAAAVAAAATADATAPANAPAMTAGRGIPRAPGGDGRPWRVHVPGGVCAARWLPDGHVQVAGPAVIVARVVLDPEWLAAARL